MKAYLAAIGLILIPSVLSAQWDVVSTPAAYGELAVANDSVYFIRGQKVFQSLDSGRTWIERTSPPAMSSSRTLSFRGLHFESASKGMLLAVEEPPEFHGNVWTAEISTADSGKNWSIAESLQEPTMDQNDLISETSDHWYHGAGSSLVVGQKWYTQVFEMPERTVLHSWKPTDRTAFTAVDFSSKNGIGVSAYPYAIVRSTDHGTEWKESREFSGAAVASVAHLAGSMWLVSYRDSLFYSSDDGVSWQGSRFDGQISSLRSDRKGNAWLLVGDVVYASRDTGQSWNPEQLQYAPRGAIRVLSSGLAFISTSESACMRSAGKSQAKKPALSIQRDIPFSKVAVDSVRTVRYFVRNVSQVDAKVIGILSTNNHFSVSPSAFDLAAHDSIELTLSFSPLTPGVETGEMLIQSSTEVQTLHVRLTGEGVTSMQVAQQVGQRTFLNTPSWGASTAVISSRAGAKRLEITDLLGRTVRAFSTQEGTIRLPRYHEAPGYYQILLIFEDGTSTMFKMVAQ